MACSPILILGTPIQPLGLTIAEAQAHRLVCCSHASCSPLLLIPYTAKPRDMHVPGRGDKRWQGTEALLAELRAAGLDEDGQPLTDSSSPSAPPTDDSQRCSYGNRSSSSLHATHSTPSHAPTNHSPSPSFGHRRAGHERETTSTASLSTQTQQNIDRPARSETPRRTDALLTPSRPSPAPASEPAPSGRASKEPASGGRSPTADLDFLESYVHTTIWSYGYHAALSFRSNLASMTTFRVWRSLESRSSNGSLEGGVRGMRPVQYFLVASRIHYSNSYATMRQIVSGSDWVLHSFKARKLTLRHLVHVLRRTGMHARVQEWVSLL